MNIGRRLILSCSCAFTMLYGCPNEWEPATLARLIFVGTTIFIFLTAEVGMLKTISVLKFETKVLHIF